MRIKNNFGVMNKSEVINEPLTLAEEIRIRINCEFLHKCEFACAGCYVNRRSSNFDTRKLEILSNTVDMFRQNGARFDEIILGPTDFFAAENTEALFKEKLFTDIFKDGDVVLTLLTTLQSDDETILERITAVNDTLTHPDQEIEALVVFDLQRVINEDMEYVRELQHKLRLLDRFVPAVDYALQMNIQDTTKLGGFTLASITTFVREHFDTIVEFNPSFLRTGKKKIVDGILDSWNSMLEEQINESNKDDITYTMANPYHAGFNEITYNFHDGDLYMCPFIYENVFDKDERFKVSKSNGDFYTWEDFINHDQHAKITQFSYTGETDDCAYCPYVMSCISKHVLYYMHVHKLKGCMISRPTTALYR